MHTINALPLVNSLPTFCPLPLLSHSPPSYPISCSSLTLLCLTYTPPHTYTTLPPSFPTQYAVTYSSTVLILPYSPSISHSLMRTTITVRMKGAGRPPLCKAWNEPWWELFISEQLIWNKISIWHLCCSIFLRLIWALFKKSVMCVVCRYSDRPDSDCRIHLLVSPWKQDLIHFQDNILNNLGLLDKLAENLMWRKKRTQKCH